jgi:hypothetical protein
MTLKQLQRILEHRKKVEKIFRDAEKVGIIDINGPLFNTVWHAIEAVTSIVDPYGWIEWFVYENEYGARELEATVNNNKTFKVKSAKDLLALIKESKKL